jgi:hypothetical protein
MDIIAFILGLGIFIIIILVVEYLFWLWMFIDALRKRDILWITLFILSFFTGFLSGVIATLYYVIAYKKS